MTNTIKPMVAYHSDPKIKAKYLRRVRMHAKLDQFIQGDYWQADVHRGCAVGYTMHSGSHEAYEVEIGVPRAIARLEDRIFEGLPIVEAKTFPVEFLGAIPVGADLSVVATRLMLWLLNDEKYGVIHKAKDETKPCIQTVINLYKRKLNGEEINGKEWEAARKNAAAAYAADAYTAAAYAADAYAAAADARKEFWRGARVELIRLLKECTPPLASQEVDTDHG